MLFLSFFTNDMYGYTIAFLILGTCLKLYFFLIDNVFNIVHKLYCIFSKFYTLKFYPCTILLQ